MTASTCHVCGFDGARWSPGDLERTLAHSDDLIGYALEGAGAEFARRAVVEPITVDDDLLSSTHSVMHRLHDVAVARRAADDFAPMVGRVDSLQASGGGVPKAPILEAEIGTAGVSVDAQGNRKHHGRPWQAICLYSTERLGELRAEGHPITAGSTGENITISGVDWSLMRGGLTISIGEVRLFTSSPAAPCQKIGDSFIDRHWNRIDHAERPGWARWYASVLAGGTVIPGDTVTVTA